MLLVPNENEAFFHIKVVMVGKSFAAGLKLSFLYGLGGTK